MNLQEIKQFQLAISITSLINQLNSLDQPRDTLTKFNSMKEIIKERIESRLNTYA